MKIKAVNNSTSEPPLLWAQNDQNVIRSYGTGNRRSRKALSTREGQKMSKRIWFFEPVALQQNVKRRWLQLKR